MRKLFLEETEYCLAYKEVISNLGFERLYNYLETVDGNNQFIIGGSKDKGYFLVKNGEIISGSYYRIHGLIIDKKGEDYYFFGENKENHKYFLVKNGKQISHEFGKIMYFYISKKGDTYFWANEYFGDKIHKILIKNGNIKLKTLTEIKDFNETVNSHLLFNENGDCFYKAKESLFHPMDLLRCPIGGNWNIYKNDKILYKGLDENTVLNITSNGDIIYTNNGFLYKNGELLYKLSSGVDKIGVDGNGNYYYSFHKEDSNDFWGKQIYKNGNLLINTVRRQGGETLKYFNLIVTPDGNCFINIGSNGLDNSNEFYSVTSDGLMRSINKGIVKRIYIDKDYSYFGYLPLSFMEIDLIPEFFDYKQIFIDKISSTQPGWDSTWDYHANSLLYYF